MSGFSDANAFLNSSEATAQYCPNPSTERGHNVQLSCHSTKPIVVYPSGRLVVFRDLDNSSNSFIYRGHLVDVTVAKFSPNGAYVASADKSGKVRVWAWTNPAHMIKMETQLFSGGVADLDWSPDNNKITAVGDNGTGINMKTFTFDTGNSLGEMVGHNKRVTSCSYRPVRPFKVVTGSEDMKTAFFAGPPFKLDHTNQIHTNFVNCVRFSPDGTLIVSVGSDKKMQFYDGVTGEPKECVDTAHAGTIYSATFNGDGTKLLTVSADKTAKLWDVGTRTAEKTFTFTASSIETVAQVSDMQVACAFNKTYQGGKFITLSLNGNLNILDADAGTSTSLCSHQGVGISASFYSSTSNTIFTADTNGAVLMRNISDENGNAIKAETTNKRSITNCVHNGAASGMIVVDDSLVVSCGWDDLVRFGVISNGTITYDDASNVALGAQPRNMSVHTHASTGGLVAVLMKDKVMFIDTKNKRSCGTSSFTGYEGKSITINSSETQIAIGGTDMKTHIYALNTSNVDDISIGDSLTVIETRSPVTALAYTSAGDMIAIGDQNQQIEVYSTTNWDTVVKGRWVFHTSQITSLEWSQSGTYLVSGSLDENIYLWNVTDTKFKKQLKFAHRGGVQHVSFTAASNAAGDGAPDVELISAGADSCVVVWKVPKA